jgi:3-phosphoshikimate 1-carboxyvinyltransferase
MPGSDLQVDNVGLNPTRIAVVDVLRRAGARVDIRVNGLLDGEPAGCIHVAAGDPRGFTIDPSEVPGIIDEIPALAALAALLPPGEVMEVRGAAELRVKESDRIRCLARGLQNMGAVVEEYPDGFRLTAAPLRGAAVDACGDHRLAMAFAVAACGASSPTTIAGASSVAISYPDFFPELFRLALSGDGR